MEYSFVILCCLFTALVTAIVVTLFVYYKLKHRTNYMLDALEDKELNFRFSEKAFFSRGFNKTLNRLRVIFDKERQEISEQERYFGQMLDYVQTGIMVVDAGKVNYCNRTALSILGISSISHIRQLSIISPSLYEAFQSVSDANEQRVSFYTERGETTITITATTFESKSSILKSQTILAFNDISNDIAENEELAWSRLIRVLTHEIMNAITPIASLSDTLSKDLASSQLHPEIMRSGLDTIATSSKGLIKFVDNYRKLTRISTPQKKPFYVRELIERILTLTTSKAECKYIEKSDDILLYADEDQISQIIVNLIRNAIQAEATNIEIVAQIEPSDAVRIDVINNGKPIPKESQEQIFVPFFTTKPDGTGIGLSLSRQIMRLHNGNIRLTRSDEKQTIFTLIFK